LQATTEMREEYWPTKEIFTKCKTESSKSKVKGYVLVMKDASST
jgi:hypothetical protein